MVEKSENGNLSTAEYALLNKLDLGELYRFEQARDLSIELLEKWLTTFKFKDWEKTETSKREVTDQIKLERAREIAKGLNDTDRWHSHGRGINMQTLKNELKLRIDDFSTEPALKDSIRPYFELIQDYSQREEYIILIHSTEVFDGFQIPTRFTP